jgi:hypothetical protein
MSGNPLPCGSCMCLDAKVSRLKPRWGALAARV